YAKAIELKPADERAFLARADHYLKTNELKLALKDLNQAALLNDKNPQTYYQRALVNLELKKENEALTDLSKAIALKPDFKDAYLHRVDIYAQRQNHTLLIADITQLLSLKTESPDLYKKRALASFALAKYTDAINDFTMLTVKYASKDADVFYKRGLCYQKLSKTTEALKDFTKVSQLQPRNDTVCLRIAEINIAMNKAPNALINYNKALSINPDNPSAHVGRAGLFMNQKKYQQASDDLDLAIRADANGEYYYLRACCRDQLNNRKGACDDLQSALALGYKKAGETISKICK
ncbi:MAG: tetratricopeptide repeat protein, partial [Bacteroidota bacterium]